MSDYIVLVTTEGATGEPYPWLSNITGANSKREAAEFAVGRIRRSDVLLEVRAVRVEDMERIEMGER